jgi:subtilisin family serine protease
MRTLSVVLVGLWALAGLGAAQTLSGPPPPKLAPAQLESRLVGEAGTVSVVLERARLRDERLIEGVGAQIEARSAHFVRVRLPAERLEELMARLPAEAFVRLPLRPWRATVQEGLHATGASAWHAQGIRGQGVRVAIIDVGFTGLSAAIAAGRIAHVVFEKDYTRLGMEGGDEPHGTDVAEILSAMAPDAELLLYRIADEVDLENAVEDALQRGARVINHSVGWVNTDFGDGTGLIAQIAQDAVRRGVVWVNAAGNAAQRHWSGPWQDPDNDGWLNVAGEREYLTLEAKAGDIIEVFLTWDEWPRARTDYDLSLFYDVNGDGQFDAETELVTASTNRQSGRQPPTESIEYIAPVTGRYAVAVSGPPRAAGRAVRVFSFNHDVTPAVAAGSIVAPATAPDVIAVGAIDVTAYASGAIEPFSSQGPTRDGRVKPDLVAPDGVETSTGRFFGTSAAAPFVAGAAALLLSREPQLSPSELRARLLAQAIDVGPPGPDTVFGVGKLLLLPEALPLLPGDGQLVVSVGKAPTKPGKSMTYKDVFVKVTPAGRSKTLTGFAAPGCTVKSVKGPSLPMNVTDRAGPFTVKVRCPTKPATVPGLVALRAGGDDSVPGLIPLRAGSIGTVEVFTLAGKKVFETMFSDRALDVSKLGLVNGVYLYVVAMQTLGGRIMKSELRKLVVLR